MKFLLVRNVSLLIMHLFLAEHKLDGFLLTNCGGTPVSIS